MVALKTKLKQQEATPKRAENTRMAVSECATQKIFHKSSRTKSIDVI